MDADTIKVLLYILYLTLLVAGGLVWYRLKHAPNGELYRKARSEGGYMPEGAGDGDAETPPHDRVRLRRARRRSR